MHLRCSGILLTGLVLTKVMSAAQPASAQVPLSDSSADEPANNDQHARPNVVFVMTDDQDLHMDSLDYMPLLKEYVTEKGVTYKRHYCTTAICCPSRVSLLTGLYAHNTNVTDVAPPWGGYQKFISQGFNSKYLPVWLQEAGYNTYYTGKLMNGHGVDSYNNPYAAGWTISDFFLDPYTYAYLKVRTQRNQEKPVDWSGNYSTDVLAQKAYGMLDDAISRKHEPFFLMIAPIAPHADIGSKERENDSEVMMKPIPADRYKDHFPNVTIPRTPDFNPENPSGASWIRELKRLNDTQVKYADDFYRARLQCLQSVDELFPAIVKKLEHAGILENTYIIFSTDNGYHIGQHRLPPGKETAFETDIHIPLMIRGPGVPVNQNAEIVTNHVDLAPTFLGIAGVEKREAFDGEAIPLTKEGIELAEKGRQEHVNVEFWGRAIAEGTYPFSFENGEADDYYVHTNTYKSLRIISPSHNLHYTVWCTNTHELYNMTLDPHQLHNLHPSAQPATHPTPPQISKLLPRLDNLLMVTKSCKGEACRRPWRVLHPQGDVNNLSEALAERFDAFYGEVGAERVGFGGCEGGFILGSEGLQGPVVFGENRTRGAM